MLQMLLYIHILPQKEQMMPVPSTLTAGEALDIPFQRAGHLILRPQLGVTATLEIHHRVVYRVLPRVATQVG